ncbi:MAG: hypothetical protein PVI57_17255 [Gemmatimonadota bacterium]|jgi:uncharacterized glyoxalase superfamily protein PhnB
MSPTRRSSFRLTPWKAAVVATPLLAALAASPSDRDFPTMKKLSPVIVVDAVEPCLPFWRDRLGFEVTATVPHEDALGFAILAKEGVEIMYQSRASAEADIAHLAEELSGQRTALFIQVADQEALDDVERALEGAEIVVPRRRTFYGMDEIFARADCGTVVGFAAAASE